MGRDSYLSGVDATAEYLLANEREQCIFPAPAYAEALVGEGNAPNGDVAEARADLAWSKVYETDEQMAVVAGEIADDVGPQGPSLTENESVRDLLLQPVDGVRYRYLTGGQT